MKRTTHSFYILMVNYKTIKKGLEAIVSPEDTRRNIVDEVRSILKEGRNEVAFVKYVDGNFIDDVTDDILEEAAAMEDAL